MISISFEACHTQCCQTEKKLFTYRASVFCSESVVSD